MKKTITSFIAIIASTLSYSQEVKNIDIQEVEVSANRAKLEFSEVAKAVQIISREQIEAAPISSVNELLEYSLSVDVRQRGVNGVQADVGIRGSNFSQVLVLLNGVRVNDPQSNHHNLNLPISLEDIERVEILNGGASRIYGPGAFAGAINIITSAAKVSGVKLHFEGGENNWQEYGIKSQLVNAKSSHSFSYLNRESDGYIRNTDFSLNTIYWNSNFSLPKGNLSVDLGQNSKSFGAQNYYTTRFPDQFEATRSRFASVCFNSTYGKLDLEARAYYRNHYDRFELFRESEAYYHRLSNGSFASYEGDTVSWYRGHNYHQTHVRGSNLNLSYKSKFGISSLGYEYRHEAIKSNLLGEDLDSPEKVENEHQSAYYFKGAFRENQSVFLEHNIMLEKLFISLGALYNLHTDFQDEFFPGIDIAYQYNNSLRPYVSVNRSLRFPTYTDLYYNLGGAVGSKNLKAEESVNYEVGAKFNKGRANGHLAVFQRQGKNLIDWIRYAGSDTTRAANITELNLSGVEFTSTVRLPNQKNRAVNFKSLQFNYTYLMADSLSKGFESNYILDFLRHQGSVSLIAELFSQLQVSWAFNYQERVGDFTNREGEIEKFNPILLSDLKLSYRRDDFDLYLKVNNLFDQSYNDIGGVILPGRWIFAGFNYRLPISLKSKD